MHVPTWIPGERSANRPPAGTIDEHAATDQEIEELKMRRAKLKDYIYHLVRHAPSACPTCEGTGVAR